MAKLMLISIFAGLAVAALVSAQTNAPNELRRVDPQNQQQKQQQQQQQGSLENNNPVTPLTNPLRLPSNEYNQNQNQDNQENQIAPISDDDTQNNNNNNNEDNSQEDSPFPFDPLGIFEPRPRPPRPHRGGLFSFFQDPMRHFERHRQMMDQQFRQMEKQAVEGESTSFFTRNGVGYKRVCTVQRIGNPDQTNQDQNQQQQQQQPSKQLQTLTFEQ